MSNENETKTEVAEVSPDAAVIEAIARALFEEQEGGFIQPANPWLTTFEGSRRPKYTRRASVALTAALPALRRQIAEEIAVAIERSEDAARTVEQRCQKAGDRQGSAEWFAIATGYMRSAELAREHAAR